MQNNNQPFFEKEGVVFGSEKTQLKTKRTPSVGVSAPIFFCHSASYPLITKHGNYVFCAKHVGDGPKVYRQMGWDLPQRPNDVRPPPSPRRPSPVVPPPTIFETVTVPLSVFRPAPTVPRITHVTPPRASQPRASPPNSPVKCSGFTPKFDPIKCSGFTSKSFSCFLTPSSEYGC